MLQYQGLHSRNLSRTLRRTRYLLLLLVIFLSLSWLTGLLSAHYQHQVLAISFLLLRVLLTASVLLRCCLDSQVSGWQWLDICISCVSLQVRGRVQRGYLKCEEVREVYEADTAAQSKATIYTSPGRDQGQIFSWSRDQVCKHLD